MTFHCLRITTCPQLLTQGFATYPHSSLCFCLCLSSPLHLQPFRFWSQLIISKPMISRFSLLSSKIRLQSDSALQTGHIRLPSLINALAAGHSLFAAVLVAAYDSLGRLMISTDIHVISRINMEWLAFKDLVPSCFGVVHSLLPHIYLPHVDELTCWHRQFDSSESLFCTSSNVCFIPRISAKNRRK